MADAVVNITAGSGTPIRVLSGMGPSSADQQVMTLADSAGNLLGTSAAPMPVSLASSGGMAAVSGSLTAAVANTPGTAVVASTTAQVVVNVAQAGNVSFHVVTSAFVGTVVFEASVDAGLNYAPILSLREDGTGAESSLAINAAASFIRQYTAGMPGLMYFRIRCSVFTSGSLAVIIQPGPTLMEPTPAVTVVPAQSASMAGVAASASSVTLLAANPSRRGASIQNGTTAAVLYARLGTPASIASGGFHVVLVAGAYYEVPVGYNGVISGIWASATGYANVGELT